MNNTYLKLATPPGLEHPGYPTCAACCVEVEYEYGWLCPSCGTSWPIDVLESDGSDAVMYEDWNGEELDGPECPNDMAWQVSLETDADVRDARVRELIGEADV